MTSNENDQQSSVLVTTALQDVYEAPVVDVAAAGVLPSLEAQGTSGAVQGQFVSPTSLPGELLAARRNELRWTLEDVSQRLKLAPRQITALEANDFASLPGMASVRE